MISEHEIEVNRETDALIHKMLDRVGEPLPYSSDEKTADALALSLGLEVIPLHEPNHTHFFDSVGVLPEEEPIGYLAFVQVEPTDEGDNLLLMHGWHSLAEAETKPLCICRSALLLREQVAPGWIIFTPVGARLPEA